MKFLIVIPRFIAKVGDYYDFPLGLAIISSVLKNDGHEVEVLNLNTCFTSIAEQLHQAIDIRGADVICCGGLSAHYYEIMEVVCGARKAKKNVTVILGGGIISSEPELMTAELDADFSVIGEGEITMAELAAALSTGKDTTKILGTLHKTVSGEIVRNEERPIIKDLNSIPFPDYEGLGAESYLSFQRPTDMYFMSVHDTPRLLPIILSRSCPYKCTFCFHPLGDKYRRSTLNYFFEQLDMLVKKYRINMLTILDELFSLNKNNMLEFCERIKPYNLKFIAQLRVDQVNREILEKLKDCGLFYISYGLESASKTVLKSMRKHITVTQIEKALALTRELGIGIQGNFIFGDPAETLKTARKTLSWWKEHYYYHINFAALIPYPGTAVYKYCLKKGLIKDKIDFLEKGCSSFNMTQLSNKDYGTIFTEIREAQIENRQFANNISVEHTGYDFKRHYHLYRLTMTCPHCDNQNTYNNISCQKLESFKIVCRNCNQRSDIPSSYFDHLKLKFKSVSDTLKKITKDYLPTSITPAGDMLRFEDSMQALGIKIDSLNLQYTLDYDREKEGCTFMNLPILHRNGKNISEKCQDHYFIIIQCDNYQKVYEDLLNFNISKDKIVAISDITT